MDPITAAIVGAPAKLSESAIKDGYDALKAVIARKYGAGSELVKAVASVEQKPESEGRKGTLQEEVKASGADRDAEILKLALRLVDKLQQLPGGSVVSQTVTGNQNVTVHGNVGGHIVAGNGNIVGDHSTGALPDS